VLVDVGGQHALKQWQEAVSKVGSTRHPLVVVPAVVMIRAIELPPRKGLLQPPEDRFMPDMHPQRYLRLATVSAEVPFADQEPGKKAQIKVARHRAFPVVHVTAPEISPIEGRLFVRLRAAQTVLHP
jgi:hypothetical protein